MMNYIDPYTRIKQQNYNLLSPLLTGSYALSICQTHGLCQKVLSRRPRSSRSGGRAITRASGQRSEPAMMVGPWRRRSSSMRRWASEVADFGFPFGSLAFVSSGGLRACPPSTHLPSRRTQLSFGFPIWNPPSLSLRCPDPQQAPSVLPEPSRKAHLG